jgi:hypothetical protein
MKSNKLIFLIFGVILMVFLTSTTTFAKKPLVKAKFYDFSDQLIDGTVRKPQTLYTNARQEAKFGRLLRLKRNFIGPRLQNTAKLPVFK